MAILEEAVESARAVGLRYVRDDGPGIRRLKAGRGFRYVDPQGRPVGAGADLVRIRHLVIPPAWTAVWICPAANGHVQVTGRDARGRKQYLYHPQWRQVRDATKFDRMVAFGEALPRLRTRVDADLARPGLPREKVLAAAVRLLETTLIRVGNAEYARDNQSFGLTTLRHRHVQIAGSELRFSFRGKSGKDHVVTVASRRLARVIRACRDLPGHELFQYVDAEGSRQPIHSEDVNAYLRQATGEDFTAKDFRTWGGTLLALTGLSCLEAVEPRSAAEAERCIAATLKEVAAQLGNRPAICRKYYVHPAVLAAFAAGRLVPVDGEEAALALLRTLPAPAHKGRAKGKGASGRSRKRPRSGRARREGRRRPPVDR